MKQLIALSQKNKQNRVLCSILQFQSLLMIPVTLNEKEMQLQVSETVL